MINFDFNIRNPWYKTWSETLWSKVFDVPIKYKVLELEVYKDGTLFSLDFLWSIRRDHAGLDFEIGVFGYNFHFNFYDTRHWNDEEGRYYKYSEELGQH